MLITKLFTLLRDIAAANAKSADFRSALALSTSFLRLALRRFLNLEQAAGIRTARLRNGLVLNYRLNRGDLQAIREVVFRECYRLPKQIEKGTLLDLGANIGLSSLWLCFHHSFNEVIAIEPDPDNIRVLIRNFESNGISSTIIRGVVGPEGATARFAFSRHSVLGHVASEGMTVDVVDLSSLLEGRCIALAKIDIEGAEQMLFSRDITWLGRTSAIIIELHPEIADCQFVIRRIVDAGFEYTPAHSTEWDNADYFSRPETEPCTHLST